MGPARQTMTVCAVVCVATMSVFFFSSVADSAPTSSKSSDDAVRTIARLTSSQTDLTREKPLTRTKRAEEILFGNHQNAPRVKKSDPAATALATSPAEGQVKAAGDDVIAAAVKTDDNSLPSEENDSGAEEEEEHLFPVENQDEEQEEGDDQSSFEGIPMEETDFPRYEGQDQQQQPQQQETVRRKRNARTAALMTAENMVAGGSVASAANRPIRAKRDLDYEELRELFENSREAPYEAEEEEEYDGDDDDFRPVAVVPVLPEDDRQNEEEAEEEAEAEEEMSKRGEGPLAVAIPYDYEPRYDAASDKVELIRELVKQKAEEDAKEKLIDYLLAAAIASSEEESEDGDEDGVVGGGGLDLDDGRRLVIEEAPVRPDFDGDDDDDDDRESIGPLAAAAKRSVFYPYSYEPYGGRWGAMVPGAKRSADDYERLYRLAEALNADDDNDYEEK